ncbi:Ankyrin repeats containing protein [Cardinium endosymbiont of Sogatella furcifera]|uniref:ankyrin repeat domain-containing protein n=1 Tax=Cardinium endosymbiont of Sogatella furcifera TaxID=650378 RepID=UPI000E0CC38B|nr:ankyrin repeat domain-containing protein [Cardinium endosymbiont of Sogatella furcifera]AXI24129.1 Ankyrin repeats containing protein [Cardinium endosymbiont of Sogatella furcifera]
MKKQTNCKVGLCIGLFIFHTLSACVNTKQTLAIDEVRNRRTLDYTSNGLTSSSASSVADNLKSNSISSLVKSVGYAFLIGIIVTNGIVIVLIGSLWGVGYLSNQLNRYNTYKARVANIHRLTPDTLPIPNKGNTSAMFYNNKINATEANRILDGIHNPKWEQKPIVRIDDPMVLPFEALAYLERYGCSKERIQYLLDQGLDPNAKDKNGNSILMYVVFCKNVGSLRLLLNKGALVNVQNRGGCTGLMLAMLTHDADDNDHMDIIRDLLAHNADSCISNHQGETAQSFIKYLPKKARRKVT